MIMAIVHISNPDDFISAINVSNNEIYLDNDIDCNSITITSSKQWQAVSFDGQGHTIYNLSMTGNDSIFSFGTQSGTRTIKNVNFANVMQPYDKAIFTNTNNNPTIVFDTVQIQGLTRILVSGKRFSFNKCTFSLSGVKYIVSGSSPATINFNLCYFNCNTIPSTVIRFTYCNLTDCYIKGEFDATGYVSSYTYFSNCNLTRVIANNDFTNTTGVTFNLISTTGSSCTNVLYNTSKMGNMSYTPVTGATGLTDTELKDPVAVVATGFPLVV